MRLARKRTDSRIRIPARARRGAARPGQTDQASVSRSSLHRNKINPEVDLFKKCGHVSMLREVIVDGQIDLRLALEDL